MSIHLPDFDQVYFLGIGGIGMSGLAQWFQAHNYIVAGYDKTPSSVTEMLEHSGIPINYNESDSAIPSSFLDRNRTLVVYTPAIPADMPQLNFFKNNGFTVAKRSVVLGKISEGHFTIAIAGTHGKTTTTSIITHLLANSNLQFTAFVGGVMANYNNNYISQVTTTNPEIIITEADEYDRSFLTLAPDIAVITSVDPDHLDIYGNEASMLETYRLFINRIKQNGTLIIHQEAYNKLELENTSNIHLITYSDQMVKNMGSKLYLNNGTLETEFRMAGLHNALNTQAAVLAANKLGLNVLQITNSLSTFKGVKRRFEYIFESDKITYIDDYAHHPTEISALILAVRQKYPNQSVMAVFQPHLFTRTRDFYQGFANSLSMADHVVLLKIYPARELPISGVSSENLLTLLDNNGIRCMSDFDGIFELVVQLQPQVLLTIGAGDIDRVVPVLKQKLIDNFEAISR